MRSLTCLNFSKPFNSLGVVQVKVESREETKICCWIESPIPKKHTVLKLL